MAKPLRYPLRYKDTIQSTQSGSGPLQPAPLPSNLPAKEAFVILRAAYVAIPILAGVDKFYDLAAHWDVYLAPTLSGWFGLSTHSTMLAVGVIEVVLGLGVAVSPRIFGNILGLWLIAVIADLMLLGGRYDVVLMTAGLAAGSFALGRLGQQFEPVPRRRLQALQ